jgi:CRP/FNR family transcriptional regulator, cyclic AMP receptor protein
MRKVPVFFGELDDRDIEWFLATGHKEHVIAGTCVVEDGRPLNSLFIVLQGAFSMTVPARGAEETMRLGQGDVIGELAFLDSRTPATTVRALSDSVVFALPHLLLTARLTQDPSLAARFYRGLAVLLAHRVRRLDLGTPSLSSPGGDTYISQLDARVLDSVHLAAARFERLLKQVLAGSVSNDSDPQTSTTFISRRRWKE